MAQSFDRKRSGLKAAALILGLIVSLPIAALVYLALQSGGEDLWQRLFRVHLANSLPDTILLLVMSGALAAFLGTSLAWLISFYEFPFRRSLQWLAFLPLAVPGYIAAFIATDTFAFSGPVQTALRGIFGAQLRLPDIRSVGGAALVLGVVLYPYVYAAARAAFQRQSQAQLDVAQTLGRTRTKVLRDIALPQAAPAIVVGVILVMLEVLNDIGAASFFGVQTVTLSVYSLWLGQDNLPGAARLSILILFAVLLLLMAMRHAEAREKLMLGDAKPGKLVRHPLHGLWALAACGVVALPVLLGFVLPIGLLLGSALRRLELIVAPQFLESLVRTVLLASTASVIVMLAGLLLAYAARILRHDLARLVQFVASIGYAIPGAVLAIGVLIPLSSLDQIFNMATFSWFGVKPGLILSGSVFALLMAYLVRFLTISFHNLEMGLRQLTPNLDAAARTMGRGRWRRFVDIHVPILKPSLAAAMLLVFVDTMKELPVTLLLRPFDFDTLATDIFASASLGQLENASIPALAIIIVGLLPIFLISRGLES